MSTLATTSFRPPLEMVYPDPGPDPRFPRGRRRRCVVRRPLRLRGRGAGTARSGRWERACRGRRQRPGARHEGGRCRVPRGNAPTERCGRPCVRGAGRGEAMVASRRTRIAKRASRLGWERRFDHRIRGCGRRAPWPAPNPGNAKGQVFEKTRTTWPCVSVERMTGIEPALSAWEAEVLPLNYIRVSAPVWPPTVVILAQLRAGWASRRGGDALGEGPTGCSRRR